MRIPDEAICSVCKRIFCCGKCREKHEIKNHAIRIVRNHTKMSAGKEAIADSIFKLCPICVNRPFPLHEVIYPEMLEHVKHHHLPLHCQKCAKMYVNIDDLREFSKCVQAVSLSPKSQLKTQTHLESSCILKTSIKSTTERNTISTQTTPNLACSSLTTPMSIVNLQWKAKPTATQDISDSVTSLKNISLIGHSISLRRSIDSVTQVETKGKLVRTTSTPLHSETEYAKPKEQTFNASGEHVSSIYNSGCDRENQNSPNSDAGGSVSTRPQPDAVNFYRKFNGRTKIATVTPLRQVMSKSIQKAFAEHGLISEQKALEQHDAVSVISDSLSSSPLDLRLSPALRRCQCDSTKNKKSEKAARDGKYQKLPTPLKQQVFNKCFKQTGKQFKTESIMITHTKRLSCYQSSDEQISTEEYNSCVSTNSVYQTCQSFEIITSTELGEFNVSKNPFDSADCNNDALVSSITPITRLQGSSINKKIIKFETPRKESDSKCKPASTEKFYTPISSSDLNEENVPQDLAKLTVVRNLSARFSPSSRPPSIRDCAQSTAYSHYEAEVDDADTNDEVFAAQKTEINLRSDETQQIGTGGILKSIVDTVLRLPSLKEKSNKITQRPSIHAKSFAKKSIIKRCASIAGSLVRSTSLMDEKQLQTLKRKRTNTIDSHLSPYKSQICSMGSVTSPDAVANEQSLASTKRFRIQGRKPIERMRNTCA